MKYAMKETMHQVLGDKLFYQLSFLIHHRRIANLKHPRSFSDKTVWLSLYDRNPEYNKYVDKYDVREHITETIGEKYLNDCYGIYNSVDEINFDELPDSFVLKPTHASGWVIACPNKAKLDIEDAKMKLSRWMKLNYYNITGEWVYKNLQPRIICERFLKNEEESGLTDYKFYCFHGEPRFIQVDRDRFANHNRTYFTPNWEKINFELGGCPTSTNEINAPENFKDMMKIARTLSEGFKFIRVDLYEVEKKIVFGELTLYNGNGLLKFNPEKFDLLIGDFIKI